MDRIDKDILRILLQYLDNSLSTNQISIKTAIAPLTAKRHLEKLEKEGYVEFQIKGKMREYELGGKKPLVVGGSSNGPSGTMSMILMKSGKKVQAPVKILWTLRYKDKTKKNLKKK